MKQDRSIETSTREQTDKQKKYSESVKSRMQKEITKQRFVIENVQTQQSPVTYASVVKGHGNYGNMK